VLLTTKDSRLSATALASFLGLTYVWFRGSLASPESPLDFGATSRLFFLLFAAALVASAGALVRRRGLWSPFQDPLDTRVAIALAGITVVSRLVFVRGAYGLFSSDGAAQGVMALHILEGKHHPALLYNLSYIGSPKAHLTAALTLVFRDPVVSFALGAVLMYAVFVGAVYALAREMLPRRTSVLAASYAIVSPGFLTAWGVHNDGGYVDVLALGTASLVLGVRVLAERDGRSRRAFWMGVLCGVGFWVHILTTYYVLAAAMVFVSARLGRKLPAVVLSFAFGFFVGDFPMLLWNAFHGWQSFMWWTQEGAPLAERLARGAAQFGSTLTTAFPVLAGYWPATDPPEPASFWKIFLGVLLPAGGASFAVRFRRAFLPILDGRLAPEAFTVAYGAMVVSVFSLSSFGWLSEEPRYLLFLYSVVPLFVATFLAAVYRASRGGAVFLGALLFFVNARASVAYAERALESAAENRRFVAELEALGVRFAHTDYFISYKYNFLSHGRLALTSALGPAQTEWYRTYRDEAAQAARVALIPRSFRMARRVCRRLDALGVSYERRDLLYPVIYDLSEKVDLSSLR